MKMKSKNDQILISISQVFHVAPQIIFSPKPIADVTPAELHSFSF